MLPAVGALNAKDTNAVPSADAKTQSAMQCDNAKTEQVQTRLEHRTLEPKT